MIKCRVTLSRLNNTNTHLSAICVSVGPILYYYMLVGIDLGFRTQAYHNGLKMYEPDTVTDKVKTGIKSSVDWLTNALRGETC